MRKTTRRFANLAAAGGLVLFAACSDSGSPTGPGGSGEISAAEAAAISDFMVGQAFTGWDFGSIGGSSVQADRQAALQSGVPIAIDYTASAEGPCPEGGTVAATVSVEGSIDDQTLAGDLDLEVVTSATSCGIVAEGTGFTIDTSPDLTLTGGFSFADGQLVGESTLTYAGAILWSSEDGRSGSCTYDVVVTLTASSTAVASGTACGTSL